MSDLIEALLKKDEGIDLDFKEKLEIDTKEQKAELSKDVSSIANSVINQGYLLIGISNDKKIIGIKGKLNEEKIQLTCERRITPPVKIEVKTLTYNKKSIGIIVIKPTVRPHKISQDSGKLNKDDIYIRRGSVVKKAVYEDVFLMIEMDKKSNLIRKKRIKLFKLLQRREMFILYFYKKIKECKVSKIEYIISETSKNLERNNINKFMIFHKFIYKVASNNIEKKAGILFESIFYESSDNSGFDTEKLLEEEELFIMFFPSEMSNYISLKKATKNFLEQSKNYILPSHGVNTISKLSDIVKSENSIESYNKEYKKVMFALQSIKKNLTPC